MVVFEGDVFDLQIVGESISVALNGAYMSGMITVPREEALLLGWFLIEQLEGETA